MDSHISAEPPPTDVVDILQKLTINQDVTIKPTDQGAVIHTIPTDQVNTIYDIPTGQDDILHTLPKEQDILPPPTNQDIEHGIFQQQSINDIKNQCSRLIKELANSTQSPKSIVKRHIVQLDKYNEFKDIALGLITMIADHQELKTTDILEEMRHEEDL